MKYLSPKKTIFLISIAFLTEVTVYLIPVILENMILQKIMTILYIAVGTLLGVALFLINGASTAIVDGEYEKKYMKSLKEGNAKDEGENFHWNPLNLSLAKRVYYSKITLCFLFPILAIFLWNTFCF